MADAERFIATPAGMVPVPDPTELTSKATEAAKDQLRRELDAVKHVLEARLDGMDKAIELFQKHNDLTPLQMKDWIHNVHTLLDQRFETVNERFRTIAMQFTERDTRTEQIARGNETALTAALNAAKEAVNQQNIAFTQATSKSEAAFIKQIDQLVALFQTGMKALDEKITTGTKTSDDKIANVEKQLTMLVGSGVGQVSARTERHETSGTMIGVIGLVVGVLGLLTAVAVGLLH